MDTYVSSLLFYFIAFFALVASQNCDRYHYQNCLNNLLSFTDKKDLIFASSAEQLNDECIQAKTALNCLTSYSKKCLTHHEERINFTNGISGPERVTKGLCSEETFKMKFLESIPCLKNVSSNLESCKQKYERNEKDIFLAENENKEERQCCSFDGYRRCLLMVLETQDDCSENTVSFLSELSNRMGGALTDGACSEHFIRCIGHSSGILPKPSKLIWIATLFLSLLIL